MWGSVFSIIFINAVIVINEKQYKWGKNYDPKIKFPILQTCARGRFFGPALN